MKISYGIITKNFIDLGTLEYFLDNAKKYGHEIYSVIIAYSYECDFTLVERLQGRVKVELIKINEFEKTKNEMLSLGVSEKSVNKILYSKSLEKYNMTSYGTNRNNVLVRSILNKTDLLFFIDTDVYPHILSTRENQRSKEEIDFIGNHLAWILKDDVAVTTSDYSGYFIIPVMNFDGLENLFIGLQKRDSYKCLQKCHKIGCLNYGRIENRKPFLTNKVLGGNLGIKTARLKNLPPFFSSTLKVDDKVYLTRGEDTLLGLAFEKIDYKCMDIDLKIFHDTFNNYPFQPNIIKDKKIKDRFFYACMGWIGRNPFLNWIKGEDINQIYKIQKDALLKSEKKVAEYLNDSRFLDLSKALENAYKNLDEMILDYNETLEAWNEITSKLL